MQLIDCQNKKMFFGIFILALIFVGSVYAIIPHTVRYFTLAEEGKAYIPLTRESNFDLMNVHGGRYRDIIDGRILSGEVDTYEHKDGPSLWPLLSAAVLAPFLVPFDTIFPGIIITDFVFPVLMLVSFYLLFNTLTGDRLFALFSAALLMLFPQLPHYIPPSSFAELSLLVSQFAPFPFSGFLAHLTYLTREAFIPGGVAFVFSLYLTYAAIVTDKKKLFAVLAGVSYGLLFYLYFFFWAFATVFLGLFFLALLATKRYADARTVFIIGAIGIVVSVPFWVSHSNLAGLSNYQELIDRMGPELGHNFRWYLWKSYAVVLLMAGCAVWVGRKFGMPVWALFLAALALAEIVVLNEQVITGFNVQSDHWSGRVFLITRGIIWLTLFYYLFALLKERVKILNGKTIPFVFLLLLIGSLASNVLYTQAAQSKGNAPFYTVDPSLMRSYEWLNVHTPKDSVVVTPSLATNIELPVYTHSRIFLARAQNSLATEDELLHRLYITSALTGVSAASIDEMIQSQEGILYFFTAKYRDRELDAYLRPEKYGGYALPGFVREKVLNEYTFFRLPEQVPYALDYIFVGPREREIGIDEAAFSKYDRVYHRNGVTIYQWKK